MQSNHWNLMKRAWKVGLGQVPLVMGDKEINVATLLRTVGEAARQGCDILVLPECALAGWSSPACRAAAESVPGPFTRRLSRLARKHRMAIVAGLEERNGPRLHNSAVFIDRMGEILLHHRKVNELAMCAHLYAKGDSIRTAEFEGRRVALDICADSWGPELTDALHLMGAEVIFSPCAWAVEPGGEATNIAWIRETYRARTRGRRITIVSANAVGPVTQGPWKGRILQGESLVTGPGGKNLLHAPRNREALPIVVIK